MSKRPPQGQSSDAPPPTPPTLPPLGEQRSSFGTSRSTRTQIAGQSRRCRVQWITVVTQLCGPTAVYFRLGVCESAEPAAVFAAFGDFGLASVLPAAFAAFGLVCLRLLVAML